MLVVDDDVLMLRLVEQTRRVEGYRVWTAAHAAGARRLLDEHAGAVDLVLTDVAMPGGLGSEFGGGNPDLSPLGACALHVGLFT